MTEARLSIRGLSVQRADADATPILQDLSFDLHGGEIIGLTGAAGSGKSTLVRALLGLTKPGLAISAGRLLFRGRDLLTMDERMLRTLRGGEIALISQPARSALHPMLRIGAQIEAIWKAAREQTAPPKDGVAVRLLERVGINDPQRRVANFAHELSGGMAQRALIAMALAGSPSVLVADEPTSGLDVTVQAQFLDWLWAETRERQLAVLLATQEPGILANYCDHVIQLERGTISAATDCRSYFRGLAAATGRLSADGPRRAALVQARPSERPIADIEELTRSFPLRRSRDSVKALSGVSLHINPGETLALIGESGSGKTTVGRCLAGLETPTTGLIRFMGKPLADYGRRELRRRLQYVRQDPFDSFDPRWTIGRSVEEAVRLHSGLTGTAGARAAVAMLERVGCDARVYGLKPREVSTGVLQKANIARALAVDPLLLILDEPTAALTPEARRELLDLLVRLNGDRKLACLFISHDLSAVAAISDRLAVMYLGQIVEIGPGARLLGDPQHPYTKALMEAHLDIEPDRRRPERALSAVLTGDIPSPINLPTGCFLASRCGRALPRCAARPQQLQAYGEDRQVRCWRATDKLPRALSTTV